MKIAVTIPDELYRRADAEAARRGLTRSRLYAEALERLLGASNALDNVTRSWEELASNEDTSLDPALAAPAVGVPREAGLSGAWRGLVGRVAGSRRPGTRIPPPGGDRPVGQA
jgi:hypothetical protein